MFTTEEMQEIDNMVSDLEWLADMGDPQRDPEDRSHVSEEDVLDPDSWALTPNGTLSPPAHGA